MSNTYHLPSMIGSAEAVELLSVKRYQFANGRQPHQPGAVSLYVESPLPKTRKDFEEYGVLLNEDFNLGEIGKVIPERLYVSVRDFTWYNIPTHACEKFMYKNINHKCTITCTPTADQDNWMFTIELTRRAAFPVPLMQIWRYLEPINV